MVELDEFIVDGYSVTEHYEEAGGALPASSGAGAMRVALAGSRC